MTEKTAQQAATVPSDHIMGVYNRAPLAFERGEGARLFTTDGQAYLDCMAGIAVNALGHSHPRLVQAVKDQAEKLWHVSNVFKIPGQEKLAKVLTDATGLDEVFFTNSGAEAIECAIKTARKYHWAKGQPERIDIIGFDGSFHGRTLAAVNASGNAAYDQKDYARACQDLSKAGPAAGPEVLQRAGTACARDGLDKADRAFKAALAANANAAPALEGAGMTAFAVGDST